MAADKLEPLTQKELAELAQAVDYAVRSKDTLHELLDWKKVGELFAEYGERVVAELKERRGRKP